jgi:hypothetical protein
VNLEGLIRPQLALRVGFSAWKHSFVAVWSLSAGEVSRAQQQHALAANRHTAFSTAAAEIGTIALREATNEFPPPIRTARRRLRLSGGRISSCRALNTRYEEYKCSRDHGPAAR